MIPRTKPDVIQRQPERTCIGCRQSFGKDEVVRLVAGPQGVVLDYREKLPGRGAYVCPRPACIQKALSRDNLSRALHRKVTPPSQEEFTALLTAAIAEKMKSLLVMSAKAGKLAAGYSAVRDGMDKGRIELLIYAQDFSDGTKEKVLSSEKIPALRQATLFTKDEMGRMLGRELVGVVGVEDRGLADAIWHAYERLKSLINIR